MKNLFNLKSILNKMFHKDELYYNHEIIIMMYFYLNKIILILNKRLLPYELIKKLSDNEISKEKKFAESFGKFLENGIIKYEIIPFGPEYATISFKKDTANVKIVSFIRMEEIHFFTFTANSKFYISEHLTGRVLLGESFEDEESLLEYSNNEIYKNINSIRDLVKYNYHINELF